MMRVRTQVAFSILLIGGYGCTLKAGGMDHPTRIDPPTVTTTTSTTVDVEVGAPLAIAPGKCDPWAQPVQEDEVPYDHDGSPLYAYDSGEQGRGCAAYEDGYTYDGNGWHAPAEVLP